MTELYPLKFDPILKPKMWGGVSLVNDFGKKDSSGNEIGESWEISCLKGDESIVNNGFLAGNNLSELLEVYLGDLAGESVFEKYGEEFPLLIKLIDAADDLSVQVHPDDEMAARMHHAYGKTEMWYILKSTPGASIYCGFKEGVDKQAYLKAVENGTIINIMNVFTPEQGDFFMIPAGTVHSIGKGIVLAEIQQPSDVTYRIFDWNRKEKDGTTRELHNNLAVDAIKFNSSVVTGRSSGNVINETIRLIDSEYFTTNILALDTLISKDYNLLDSFVILVCTNGQFVIHWDKGSESVSKGETILVPAIIRDVVLEPQPNATLLEVYINATFNDNNQ